MATLTQGEIYALAVIVGMPKAKTMAAIAMAESSGRTHIVNEIGCVGLWQINQPVWVKQHPKWTVEWLKNPFNNAVAAKAVYNAQGLDAWEAYTGPDGAGDDGPWRKFDKDVDGKLVASDLGMTEAEFKKAIEDNEAPVQETGIIGEAVRDAKEEAEKGTPGFALAADAWEAVTSPAFWMRMAYGVTGVILIVGGLMLIVRNSSAVKSAAQTASNVVPVGRVAKAVKGATR